MIPVSGPVREAVRRGDLGWLAAHLGPPDCTPAVLTLLVRQEDPRLRHLGLDRLGKRLASPGVDEAALAAVLPRSLDGPPETALLLAGLYQRLWRHLPPQSLPSWRAADLPARVRIAWLRAEILNAPETIRHEPAGELLYQAVDGIAVADAARPEDLVRELAGGDAVLRGSALRLAREGLHAALLSPARVREHLVRLLDTPDPDVTVAVLRELAEPWAASAPFPRERLHPFLAAVSPASDSAGARSGPGSADASPGPGPARASSSAGPAVIDAAIAVAARHGHGDLLRDVVADEAMPPRSRQEALRTLGELAGRDDVQWITEIATADPLLFGAPAIAYLRAMHRRGVFPGGDDAAAIVDLALADHSIPAPEVATIMFTCRHEAFRALVIDDAEDRTWPRRLALLVSLARQGSGDLPVGDAITAVLPATSRPEPFLAAVRALRHEPAEAAVIDALPRAPEAALHALEAIGGPRTVAVLEDGLDLPIAPHLRAVRHQALELRWHLTEDPDRRRTILARLNPHDVPRRIATDLGAADQRELALLSAGVDPADPVDALLRLARNGDAATLPIIADILLRLVAELATSRTPGLRAGSAGGAVASDGCIGEAARADGRAGGAGRSGSRSGGVARADGRRPGEAATSAGRPAGFVRADGWSGDEPAVPDEIVAAIQALGARLHHRGKLRPFCLREARDAHEAGHALVATIVLDLLDRPGLSGGEQAVLLAMLRQAPYPGTRARVHRLLRHRDRHVRKQVIALLAAGTATATGSGGGIRTNGVTAPSGAAGSSGAAGVSGAAGTGGDDVEALSGSLIVLTAARDVQTVRQALSALGQVRARWSASAIAACLDHPAMNIKKTAAEALVHAGTPAAVPKLLFWLGHHDNPGLRVSLVAALRAILGDAYPATVLAAAEHAAVLASADPATDRGAGERASGDRTVELLLDGLGRVLSARAVNAFAEQGSPVAPTLLALVVAGRVRLGFGTVDDLARQLAAHGIAAPADRGTATSARADEDIDALAIDGWDTGTARRLVDRQRRQAVSTDQLIRLRPLLADWLDLAESTPATRPATLRLITRVCPAPWSADEITMFARAARTLVDGLADADGGGDLRDDLLALLEAVAPALDARAPDVISRIRALPPTAAGRRSTLPLLRRCGAVLTRADAEQALSSARLGPDPWRAESAVLRDAFAVPPPTGSASAAEGAAVTGWRRALEAAAGTPAAITDLRSRDDHAVPSRDRLNALIEVYPSTGQRVRGAILDWMEALQPIDAPPWTLTEIAHRPTAAPRTPRDGDLDQPRSAVQHARLLADLDGADASRRDAAARTLRDWPEPDTCRAVLRAFLRGRADVTPTAGLAHALTTIDEADLAVALPERLARVLFHLDLPDLHLLLPLLLEWWEHGEPALRTSAGNVLRRVPADIVAERLRSRLDAGAWGFLDLLADRPLLRTPALTEVCRRLRAEGRDDLAGRLALVDGPLRDPGTVAGEPDTLTALRERPHGGTTRGPSRHELFTLIRTGHGEQIRRALTHLAEADEARETQVAHAAHEREDHDLEQLLADLLHHPESRVRAHAHRIGRTLLDRPTYLRHTAVLLDDPVPSVVRSAINTLSHAGYRPAVPALVALLTHPHTAVRRAAIAGLVRIGSPAVSALTRAAGHARPDRRRVYTAVLDRITETT